jgi:hypothetical protein
MKVNAQKVLMGIPEAIKPLDVDKRIILKWGLKRHGEMVWTGFIWLTIRTFGGLL